MEKVIAMKKKMTKAEVKELLRRIIEFEVGRAFTRNMDLIKKGVLNRGQVEDLIQSRIDDCDFVTEDDIDDRVGNAIDNMDLSDTIQSEISNMDLVDEDRVNDIVSDKINDFDFEHDISCLEDKTRRIDDDIAETEVDIRKVKERLDNQKYDFEKKIAELKKEIVEIRKGV